MDSYGEIPFHESVDCLSLGPVLHCKGGGNGRELFRLRAVHPIQKNIGNVVFKKINTDKDCESSTEEQEINIVEVAVKQEIVEDRADSNLLLYVKKDLNPQQLKEQLAPYKINSQTKALREVKKIRVKPVSSENEYLNQEIQEIKDGKIYQVLVNSQSENREEIKNTNSIAIESIQHSKSSTLQDTNSNELKTQEGKFGFKKTNEDQFECGECGRKFREKSHLATHSRAHVDIRNYKCEICDLRFKTKTNLYYHSQTHSDSPFTCTDCNKTFPERKMLKRHIRVVHSQTERHTCDQCNRSFKSMANLSLHYSLHTGSKPFQCSLCPKSFVYKSTLVGHLKVHEAEEKFNCTICPDRKSCSHQTGGRPWLCTICGKGYPLKGTLKAHMKTHDPEKPFKCKECPKSFMKKQSYESHLATHNGEGPQFMCDQCSQSYFNVFALKRHYLKHTSARGFICEKCSKAFWMKDALKVHMRSHQSIKGFPCPQCPKAFAHKHTLEAHLKTHHQQQEITQFQKTTLQIL